jgi:hypothetical protein
VSALDPQHWAARFQEEEEHVAMQLVLVVAPERAGIVMEELKRREDLFARVWQETAAHSGETPLLAARRSVYDDVVRGRL